MNIIAWLGLVCNGVSMIARSMELMLGEVNDKKEGAPLFIGLIGDIFFIVFFYKFLFCM